MSFAQPYTKLDERLYRRVLPMPLDTPKLVHRNDKLLDKLELNDPALDWQAIIAGNIESLIHKAHRENHQLDPIAMAYAGHQFGQWAGQLGDGRAILLAQKQSGAGRYDLQLKGAGRTPYSRYGDGRAMIDSSVREYLCGHALNHLGVVSSDSIGLVVSDTYIARQQYERAASILRVSDCHIRLGHFEWVAVYAPDYLASFTDTMIAWYYPDYHHPIGADVAGFLMAVAEQTAIMIAKWQLIGFSHGVMNTDNLSITGTTIDFGPFGFMEGFYPTWINNHSDSTARYCYQNQPAIGQWNLAVFVRLFEPLGIDKAVQMAVLERYECVLLDTYQVGLMAKLGVLSPHTADTAVPTEAGVDKACVALAYRFLHLLQNDKADYTNSFRSLIAVVDDKQQANFAHEHQLLDTLIASFSADGQAQLKAWISDYRHYLVDKQAQTALTADDIIQTITCHNPVYILRNHMAQRAIGGVKDGNFDELARLFTLLSTPYQSQAIATPDDTRVANAYEQIAISCLS